MATRVASGKVMNAHRAAAAGADRRLGGPRSVDPHGAQGTRRLQSAGRRRGRYARARPAAAGVMPDATCISACASTRWARSSTAWRRTAATMPYGSTFLIFSDYMRPPIRLAALMGLHVVHVFTHDSIALGEDGPTHQPVEQLAALRAIPNLTVIRPGDANETAVAWRVALETRDRPVALVLTRQAVPTLDRSRYAAADGLRRGAYVLSDAPDGKPELDPDRERLGGRSDRGGGGTTAGAGHRRALRLDAELGAVRCAAASTSATRCCRRRCARAWRSKRAWRRAGTATSAMRRRAQRGALRCLRARQRDAAGIRLHRRQRLCPRSGVASVTSRRRSS